jgi:hypothetical protein
MGGREARECGAVDKGSEGAEEGLSGFAEVSSAAVLVGRQLAIALAELTRLLRLAYSSKKPRPSHSSFPPSLVDLPWPLPVAPELHRYGLTVPRPVFVAPPPYSEDVNEESGESSVMSGEAPSYQ